MRFLLILVFAFIAVLVYPASPHTHAAAQSDPISLSLWTYEGGPPLDSLLALVRQFEAETPGVTVNVTARDIGSYLTQVRLALTGSNPPDIVGGVQGYSLSQELIEAGLIMPLDDFATRFAWESRYPETLLAQFRYSRDGSIWGSGPLWGAAQFGEIIGVFYSRETLASLGLTPPSDFDEFLASLGVAAESGISPIAFGNLERYPGEFLFSTLLLHKAGPGFVRALVYGDRDVTWDTTTVIEAMTMLRDWGEAGTFTPGFNSYDEDGAFGAIVDGSALFFITGPWYGGSLADALGDNAGFFLVPMGAEAPYTQGGLSQPYHITSASQHADVAASLIDYIVGPNGVAAALESGDLPAGGIPDAYVVEGASGVQAQVIEAWGTLLASDGLVPFVGFSTPTVTDVLYPGIQDLLARRVSPEELARALQRDREEFLRR